MLLLLRKDYLKLYDFLCIAHTALNVLVLIGLPQVTLEEENKKLRELACCQATWNYLILWKVFVLSKSSSKSSYTGQFSLEGKVILFLPRLRIQELPAPWYDMSCSVDRAELVLDAILSWICSFSNAQRHITISQARVLPFLTRIKVDYGIWREKRSTQHNYFRFLDWKTQTVQVCLAVAT